MDARELAIDSWIAGIADAQLHTAAVNLACVRNGCIEVISRGPQAPDVRVGRFELLMLMQARLSGLVVLWE